MWLDREISLLPSEGGILDFSIPWIFNVSLNVTICLSEVVSPFFFFQVYEDFLRRFIPPRKRIFYYVSSDLFSWAFGFFGGLSKLSCAKLVEFIADYPRQNRQEEFLSFLILKRKASSRRQTAYLYNDRQSRPSV